MGNVGDSGTIRAAVFAGKEVRHIRQQNQNITPDDVFATGDQEATASYTLRVGQHFPAHATKCRLRSTIMIRSVTSGASRVRRTVTLLDGDGNKAWVHIDNFMMIFGDAPPTYDGFEFDAFLPVGTPNATNLNLTVDYSWDLHSGSVTFTSPPDPIQLAVLVMDAPAIGHRKRPGPSLGYGHCRARPQTRVVAYAVVSRMLPACTPQPRSFPTPRSSPATPCAATPSREVQAAC